MKKCEFIYSNLKAEQQRLLMPSNMLSNEKGEIYPTPHHGAGLKQGCSLQLLSSLRAATSSQDVRDAMETSGRWKGLFRGMISS